MAVVTGIKTPEENVWPTDLVPGQFYLTAQGHVAYVATKTNLVFFGDPTAQAVLGHGFRSQTNIERFPFKRLATGTAITIIQEAPAHA